MAARFEVGRSYGYIRGDATGGRYVPFGRVVRRNDATGRITIETVGGRRVVRTVVEGAFGEYVPMRRYSGDIGNCHAQFSEAA